MWSLGFAASHDSCVCLLEDDRLAAAVAVERLVRVKRAVVSSELDRRTANKLRVGYLHAIRRCCESAGILPSDIDYFSVASPDSEDESEIRFNNAMLAAVLPKAQAIDLPHPEHHLAHAYSAFFCSGYESAVALVADSFGSPLNGLREEHTGLLFTGRGTAPETVFKHWKPDASVVPRLSHNKCDWILDRAQLSGIGEIYRLITILIGFWQRGTQFDDAGKTMGLAPYGKRLSGEPLLIRTEPGGGLDCSGAFPFLESRNLITRTREGIRLSVRGEGTPLSQFHMDLAAQVQWELQEATVHLARHLREWTGCERLVLAGGVFLNACANRMIAEKAGFGRVYVCPAATDDGTSIGAAYFAYQQAVLQRGASARSRMLHNLAVGPSYEDDQIGREVSRWHLSAKRLNSAAEAASEAGKRVAAGEIIGWFQGGSELGPRALGHRSIIADPQEPRMKHILNERVKYREGFRPFAPAVLLSAAKDLFLVDSDDLLPFMLRTVDVPKHYRNLLPGITHVDGTARLQTVSPKHQPLFFALIEAYARERGLPVVINTSFNLRGMPIVESPFDAIDCFSKTEMDSLVMGPWVVDMPNRMNWVPVADPSILVEAEGRLGKTNLALRVRIGQDTVDRDTFLLLRAMDGNKTVADLALQLHLKHQIALRRTLHLMRREWCHWAGAPTAGVRDCDWH